MASDNLTKLAPKIKAMAHHQRLAILNYIQQKRETNVSGIHKALKMEQSVTSQQLKVLRLAGLVIGKRAAKEIFYKVNNKEVNHVLDTLKGLLK